MYWAAGLMAHSRHKLASASKSLWLTICERLRSMVELSNKLAEQSK